MIRVCYGLACGRLKYTHEIDRSAEPRVQIESTPKSSASLSPFKTSPLSKIFVKRYIQVVNECQCFELVINQTVVQVPNHVYCLTRPRFFIFGVVNYRQLVTALTKDATIAGIIVLDALVR